MADADVAATAAEVAYVAVVTSAAYYWRRGGRASEVEGAVLALVSDRAAADPITAAAAQELGSAGQGSVAAWMDRHFDEIAECADGLLAMPGDAPDSPLINVLGLHPDMVSAAVVHRRTAQMLALEWGGCAVADAVICGAVAEAKVLYELAGQRAGDPLELAQMMLLDPLVRTAVWERGASRALYLWRWIDSEWACVWRRAATTNSLLLWEKEVLG